MAKTLREKSEQGSPTKKSPPNKRGFGMVSGNSTPQKDVMRKRDKKAQEKKNPFSSLFDSNPFNKKPRFQKTLIATPSKFEIKVTKSKSPAAAKTPAKKAPTKKVPALPSGGIRGKLGKKNVATPKA